MAPVQLAAHRTRAPTSRSTPGLFGIILYRFEGHNTREDTPRNHNELKTKNEGTGGQSSTLTDDEEDHHEQQPRTE